jgi:hypothetical protein
MSAEPFSQPLTRERKVAPRGSILPGFLVAAGLAAVAGVLLALYGPTYAGDPDDSTRQVSGGWSHALFYALATAAVVGLGLHVWSDRVRRAPITLAAALGVLLVAGAAVSGGMVFLKGNLQRHYAAVPVLKAYRYYAWALEKDYGDYRTALTDGQSSLSFWQAGEARTTEAHRRVEAARAVVAKYKALDERRIRESRWLIDHSGLFGPAQAAALAEFDKRMVSVRRLQKKRWLSQEGLFDSTEDLIDLWSGDSYPTPAIIARWQANTMSIRQAEEEEFTTLCVISKVVVDACVFTDDKRPRQPD